MLRDRVDRNWTVIDMSRCAETHLIFIVLAISFLAIVCPVKAAGDFWETKATLPQGGAVYGAVAVEGKIYAFGAYHHNANTYYTSGKYDPATNTWISIPPMPTLRIEFATAVHENKIYIIGGKENRGAASLSTVEVYDPATNSWTSRTSMPTARDSIQANVVNGKIYVISGEISLIEPHPGAIFSDATEVYDPKLDTWSSAANIPNHVAGYASAVLDNKIYIIGGATEEPPVGWHRVNTTQIYEPETDKWRYGASSPYALELAVACATTGEMAPKRIYVFDGYGDKPADLNLVYEPISDEWTSCAKQSFYGEVAVAGLHDIIYVIGGSYSELSNYDPWGYNANPDPVYNPPPPFPSVNYKYTPMGYGTSDLTAPNIVVVSPENKEYTSDKISVNFTANEPTNWTAYRLDGQQITAIEGNITLNGLKSGSHNMTLYAIDAAGNTAASETIKFTIVKEPDALPTTAIAVASVASATIALAGLMLYFKKRKH